MVFENTKAARLTAASVKTTAQFKSYFSFTPVAVFLSMDSRTALFRFLLFFLIIVALFFLIEIVPLALQKDEFFTTHFTEALRSRAPRMLLVAVAAAFFLSRRMRAKNSQNETHNQDQSPP